jgi:hypothetical protein
MRIERVGDGPIITADTDPSIGQNIQGPSLIRAPDWLEAPLGRFLLYFADHKGSYIRLAFADHVEGPWRVHPPGSLHLADSGFPTEPPAADDEQLAALADLYTRILGEAEWSHDLLVDAVTPHIASPDIHVDHERRRFVMYLHGLDSFGLQVSRAALSDDGVTFVGRPEGIGNPYLRAFAHDGMTYALTMPGVFLRSRDGLSDFERGPQLFEPAMRHSAVAVRDGRLHVFWTRVGDSPESILHSTVDLADEWDTWSESPDVVVLRPEFDWEGADAAVEPSKRSTAYGHVNQLRDPAVFVDDGPDGDGRSWLLYAVAGESGIALAEIHWDD